MAVKERIFLFHGNDSRSSSLAVRQWERIFLEKYGMANRYRIEADELDPGQFSVRLSEATESRSLFGNEPTLCLVRRPCFADKGSRMGKHGEILKDALSSLIARNDPSITIAVWEDRRLPDTHPLLRWFQAESDSRHASIRVHTVPSQGSVKAIIQDYCAQNKHVISPDALAWLIARYQDLEREQRIIGKLKAVQPLERDWRAWWLYQVLDVAMLAVSSNVVTLAACEQAAEWEGGAVSVFEIVNAVSNRQWAKARLLLNRWEAAEQDEGSYFGLYALLERQFRQQGGEFGALGMKRMAEVEVLVKNGMLPNTVVADLLMLRLGQGAKGQDRPLLPYRKLWIASLARS